MKKLLLGSAAVIFSITVVHIPANAQGGWKKKADFGGIERWFAVGFSIGNKGYIGTGEDNTYNPKNDFWEWDQATDTWTQKADFGGTARYLAVGFSIGIKGYIGTGAINGPVYYNDFWEWDQTTNVWTQKIDFGGAARGGAVAFSIGTKGYIGTGGTTSPTQDFWEWDQVTDTWTQKANFGGGIRWNAVGFSIGNKGYIGTGDSTGVFPYAETNDFWEWDQATNVWIQKADFGGVARQNAVGFSIGAKGYIGTGSFYPPAFSYLNDFWEYVPVTNTWTQKTNFFGTARAVAVGFSIGIHGYIGTGDDGVSFKKDFWEYCDTCSATTTDEINNPLSISIYPNPFSSQTTLQTVVPLNNATLTVYNSQGQQVKQFVIRNSDSFVIRRDNLPSGLYFVRLTTPSPSGGGTQGGGSEVIATGKLVITD